MKILQIITLSELGGAQSVVANLANNLYREGHDVIVASGEGDGKMWAMMVSQIQQVRCKHLKRALSPIDDLWTILDFCVLYWKYNPDIIHLHSSKAGMLGRIAFPSCKVIYTVHGFDSIRLAYPKFLPVERFMQRACKAIIGVSKYDEKNLREEGISHHVSYIYNGVKIPQSLGSDPFFNITRFQAKVLCIARLSPPKKIDLFIEVARLLPEYAFIWIGNQSEVELDIPDNIFFKGNLSNAGAYNEYADLFILPSNYEGLPMVILEAMAFGKPIVASDVGGISEIVTNDWNGYTVKNTAVSFADKIKYVLDNKEICQQFSMNSRRRFHEELTVEKMADAYLAIYNS